MAGKRDYGQFCGLAAGLNIIGERWTLLVVREFLIGPVRFNDLLDNLPGIGPNLLSERLRTLTEHGLIEQLPVPGDGRARLYRLTEDGEELRAPVLSLARWGLRFLTPGDRGGAIRAEWGYIAVQAMVLPDRVPDAEEFYEFRVGTEIFTVEVRHGKVAFALGRCEQPDLVVTSDPDTFIQIGARMLSPFGALAAGLIGIEGSADAVRHCMHLLDLT